MRWMLDTHICIYVIKQSPVSVIEAVRRHAAQGIGISAITAAELSFGVVKSRSSRNRVALPEFLASLEIASFDERAADAYGDLRAALESAGQPIGLLDTQIAAHALSLGVTVVSNNLREFERVPGLRCANWA